MIKLLLFSKDKLKKEILSVFDQLDLSYDIFSGDLSPHYTHAIIFGGDGTVLKCSHILCDKNIPILSFNTGNLGFLTSFELKDLKNGLLALKNDELSKDKRKMLEVTVGMKKFYALNEVVISRATSSSGCILELETFVEDTMIEKFKGDGIILSTATGSTAYALSAGGPIVEPTLECVIIAPICPHSLHSRPLILNSGREVTVKIAKEKMKGELLIDGRKEMNLNHLDMPKISSSNKEVIFLKPKENFFEKLNRKLSRWSD